MKINVRKGEPDDVPNMLELIKELANYEKAPNEVITTEASMLNDGFGADPIYKSLIVEVEGKIVGLAIFYICYSTWKGKIVYLDDIIVTESMRGKGIGRQLFEAVGRFAKEAGANHFRWHVLDWNAPAIGFYKKYDATLDPTWITCKMNKEQIKKF